MAAPDTPKVSGKVLSKAELFEKLVGPITLHNPMKVMAERRGFFERLIEFCEHNGEPLTMVTRMRKREWDENLMKYILITGSTSFKTKYRSSSTIHWCQSERRVSASYKRQILEEFVHRSES